MQPVYLFSLASSRAEWLSVRQAVTAENVTNANTPNYRAREVAPFEATLERTALGMRATDPRHASFSAFPVRTSAVRHMQASDLGTKGNDVSLEREMIAAGEISRDYQLNTAIVKSFHRMWMASVKG